VARRKKKNRKAPATGAPTGDDEPDICPRCAQPAPDDESARECEVCGATHHAACWEPGCAACAAKAARAGTTIVALPPAPAPASVEPAPVVAAEAEAVGTPVVAEATAPAPVVAPPPTPPTGNWAALRRWLDGLREEFSSTGAAVFLLAVIAVAAYANCFQVPFLFDDAPVVTRNRLLWQWETWWDLFWWNPTRGLTNLTFLINFKLAGTSTVQPYGWQDWWSFHLVSLLIHLANGCLVFRLVRDLLRARPTEVPPALVHWVALLGAAVWVAHPANTMAVTYIAQRYALLAATAFLGTLVLFVRLRLRVQAEGPSLSRDWPALLGLGATALCCLFTKENAWVAPGGVLLIEVLFFHGGLLRNPRTLVPVLGVGALALIVAVAFRLHVVGGNWDYFFPARSPGSDRWQYATTQVVVTLRYLHLWLMPHDLCVEQSFPVEWDSKGQDMAVAGAGHLLLLVLAALLLRRGLRFVPFTIFWFYLTNIVESSFIPILDPMVDHRMYLPTAVLGAALAASGARAWPWLVSRAPRAREALPIACMVLVAVMVAGTLIRNIVWTSSTGIWEDTIKKRPDCARAYSSLGMEHLYAGEWLQAIQPIETALLLGPYHVEGWNNLGKAYLELEQWDEAAASLQRGIEVDRVAPSPSTPLCWNNLGLVYFNLALRAGDNQGRAKYLDLAVPRLAEAARLDPSYEVAWINLGNARFQLMALTEGETRKKHAEDCLRAVDAAEGVALRRGGVLPVSSYRYRSLALSELGRAIEGFAMAKQLAQLYGAENPPILDDLGRLAVAAAKQHRAKQAAAGVGPSATGAVDALPAEVKAALDVAAKALDGLLQKEPSRANTRVLRAQVAEQQGDRALAVRVLREGLATAPAGQAEGLVEELRRLGENP
jgi:tetratricopeptide (TPR) repeat protein